MLLSLNDDCLRLIIKNLTLKDQISCVFVCKRMKIVTTEIWKPMKKEYLNMLCFNNMPLEYFIEYVKCISNNVEDLGLREVDLKYLKNIEFPKVHSLICVKPPTHSANKDKLIKDLFPNLTRLRLEGKFTGSHLQDLTNLETLELTGCHHLKERYFQNIYTKLTKIKKLSFWFYLDRTVSYDFLKNIFHCQTLEEIDTDRNQFLAIYEELFKLRKLRKIVCFFGHQVEDILRHITNKFGSVLHTLEIRGAWDCASNGICQSIQKLVSLRKLILSFIQYKSYDLFRTIAASLSQTLEEFHYRTERFNDSYYDGLLEVVRRCTKLKILNLSNTKIDLNFVKKVAAIIASTDEERNQVLVMNCSLTRVKIDQIKTIELPKKLQVSFVYKKFEINSYLNLIRCEWNTPIENN